MHVNQKVLIHNKFDILIHDVNTGELVGQFESYNIVLDQMWTRLCGGSSYFVNIHFGTGDGTLSAARTSLFTHLGTKAAADEEQVKALPVSRWKRKIVLNPEEFVGATITEVGIAFGATATNLVTHSKLKDAEGNPISLPAKTATQVITIYATVFVTLSNQAGVGMISMPSNNKLINYLIGGGTAVTGAFYLTEVADYGESIGASPTVTWTSDIVNKKRKTNTVRFGIDVGNGNVLSVAFDDTFKVSFPAPGIYEGRSYVDVPVGMGDGIRKKYTIPSKNIKNGTLNVKANGVTVNCIQKKIKGPLAAAIKVLPSVTTSELATNFAISKNGNKFIANYNEGNYVHVWDLLTRVKESIPAYQVPYGGRLDINYDGTLIALGGQSYGPYHSVIRRVDNVWVYDTLPATIGILNIFINSASDKIYEITNASPYLRVLEYVNSTWVRNTNLEVTLPSNNVKYSQNKNAFTVFQTTSPFFKVYDLVNDLPVPRPFPTGIIPTVQLSMMDINNDGSVIACRANNLIYIFKWDGSAWSVITFTATFNPISILVIGQGEQLVLFESNSPSIIPLIYILNDGQYEILGNLLSTAIPYTGGSFGLAFNEETNILALNRNGSGTRINLFHFDNDLTEIELETPPLAAVSITSDYTVEGVHKTNQYVIDVSFSIQFGEGA